MFAIVAFFVVGVPDISTTGVNEDPGIVVPIGLSDVIFIVSVILCFR